MIDENNKDIVSEDDTEAEIDTSPEAVELPADSGDSAVNDTIIAEPNLAESPTDELVEKKSKSDIVKIAGILAAVCVAVVTLIAVINVATHDIIFENAEKERQASIFEIFPNGTSAELFEGKLNEIDHKNIAIHYVYMIKNNADLLGYCVSLSSMGFGGEIELLIGVTADKSLVGVKILSMSETPGLGSKVSDTTFLSQFDGKTEAVALGADVDAVTGATVSSKAVILAVNSVYALNLFGDTLSPEPDSVPFDPSDDAVVPAPDETQPPERDTSSPEMNPPVIAPVETDAPAVTSPAATDHVFIPPVPPETITHETTIPVAETTPVETEPPAPIIIEEPIVSAPVVVTEPPVTQAPQPVNPPPIVVEPTVTEPPAPPVENPDDGGNEGNDWSPW